MHIVDLDVGKTEELEDDVRVFNDAAVAFVEKNSR
jgi:hypothetical protein